MLEKMGGSKMKKRKLTRGTRMLLGGLFLAAALGCAFLIVWFYSHPGVLEEEIPVYTYGQKAGIDYQVEYMPNMLTKSGVVERSGSYISKYVKSVHTVFNYCLNGDQPVDFQGEYYALATIRGTVRDGENRKTIWEKRYELLPRTAFQGRDRIIELRQEMPVRYRDYNDFTGRFLDDTEIKCDTDLVITWQVNLVAQTDKKSVVESISADMTVPLNVRYFEITGNLSSEKNNSIQETVQSKAPIPKSRLIALAAAQLSCLAALGLILFCTEGSLVKDPLQARIKKIFQEYGDRLVALETAPDALQGLPVQLKSFEDLIRAADELGKPVFYGENVNNNCLPVFYVLDESRVFIYEPNAPKESGRRKVRSRWVSREMSS
jgi:hypothetical protein